MPKPATVEDEVPSPVSPVDEQPTTRTYSSPTPVAARAVSPQTFKSEAPVYTKPAVQAPSVNELQGRFEELLINQPPFSTAEAASSGTRIKREIPSMFQLPEVPKMSSCVPTEVPSVARSSAARDKWFAELAAVSQTRQNAIRNHTGVPVPHSISNVFSVYCNHCSQPIPDEHYHCSTCDDGDFDLCQSCVDDGVLCGSDDHWMIKRFVKDGKVINSTTETIAPKPSASESKTTLVQQEEEEEGDVATRTCNSCITGKIAPQAQCIHYSDSTAEMTEDHFVTCLSCDDYDLCLDCHRSQKHGHHPMHAFSPAVEGTQIDAISQTLLASGRHASHNAICDGCDKVCH